MGISAGPVDLLKTSFYKVEAFFDRVKLGYKWRFDRWNELQILMYRGYGTQQRLLLKGRVLDDKGASLGEDHESVWKNIVNTIRRIETDEIPNARVRIAFQRQQCEAETDEDGFFDVVLELEEPLPDEGAWHEVEAELLLPASPSGEPVRAPGQVIVPSARAEFGVISDLDDTVLRTGATDRFKMMRVVLLNNARTRAPFEGVSAFYHALQRGPDRQGLNPIFYVSSSPWNLYGLFAAFMDAHDVPAGPIFLKDFGFTENRFWSTGHQDHKLEKIRRLLGVYPDLPFVLIGDSGQQDPEIYQQVVEEHPGRIRAIFVRDVTPPERDRAVERIADAVAADGPPMFLVQDTEEAAEHALYEGLIHPDAREEIRVDRHEGQEEKRAPGLLEKLLG